MPVWTRKTLRTGLLRLWSKRAAAPADSPTETFLDDAPAADISLRSWGPFENLELLGEGAFGSVYRAFDPRLRREVALKVLRASGGQEALLNEARTLAKLRHPNIVPVYGVEAHLDRIGFWSELIDGRTLAAIIRTDGPLSAREAAVIGIDLCGALSAVHRAGLVHGDIKAENVMREEGGRLLLVDFGLSHESRVGAAVGGTPLYMAPELFQGKRASAATDVYALGVMLYFLVSGKFPYAARTVGELRDSFQRGARLPLIDARPTIPAGLARVVERAAHPEAAKRYATAGQLHGALSEFLVVQGSSRTRRWLAAAVAVAALSAAGAYYREISTRGTASPAAHEMYLEGQKLMARYDQPGNLDRAMKLFETTIAADGNFALAHAALAQAHWTRFIATRDAKQLSLAKQSADRAMELNRDISSIYVIQGEIHNWTGKRDLGAQELQRALALDASNAAAVRALASSYYNQKRMKEAEDAYRRAVDLEPDNWENYFAFGNFETRRSDFPKAIRMFQDALDRSPNNPLVTTNLGNVYMRQENFAQARQMYERSVKIDPRYRALANLGTVLLLEAKYGEARFAFARALEQNASDHAVCGSLAIAHRWSGDPDGKSKELFLKAAELAEAARRNEPANSRLLAALGSYYAAAGEPKKSLPFLRQAVALGSDDADTNWHAGGGFEQLGLRNDAVAAVNAALRLGFPRTYVERNPELTALRGDPRYRKSGQ